MFAVIFKAQVNELDNSYSDMSARMKELAINQYGCVEFITVTEGSQEITVSYWENEEQIRNWKHDSEHLAA